MTSSFSSSSHGNLSQCISQLQHSLSSQHHYSKSQQQRIEMEFKRYLSRVPMEGFQNRRHLVDGGVAVTTKRKGKKRSRSQSSLAAIGRDSHFADITETDPDTPTRASKDSPKKKKKSTSRRSQKRSWTKEEITALKEGVDRFGYGNWGKMLAEYEFKSCRTENSLLHKARNLGYKAPKVYNTTKRKKTKRQQNALKQGKKIDPENDTQQTRAKFSSQRQRIAEEDKMRDEQGNHAADENGSDYSDEASDDSSSHHGKQMRTSPRRKSLYYDEGSDDSSVSSIDFHQQQQAAKRRRLDDNGREASNMMTLPPPSEVNANLQPIGQSTVRGSAPGNAAKSQLSNTTRGPQKASQSNAESNRDGPESAFEPSSSTFRRDNAMEGTASSSNTFRKPPAHDDYGSSDDDAFMDHMNVML